MPPSIRSLLLALLVAFLTYLQFAAVITTLMTLIVSNHSGDGPFRMRRVVVSLVLSLLLIVLFIPYLWRQGRSIWWTLMVFVPVLGPFTIVALSSPKDRKRGFEVLSLEKKMSGPSDPLLDLIDELDRLAKSRDDAWQVPREEGEILRQIALAHNAKTIVEVGTSYGFSGLFWAGALRITGGKLHTIDRDPKKYKSCRETFAKASVADLVNSYLGDALTVLPTMPSSIDIAFIDADKPNCLAYFDILWPKISPGGCIITDNAATHRAELADYVKYVRSLANAVSTEVNVGNGIEWTIKKP